MNDLPEHVAANRQYWDAMADDWVASGERAWSRQEPNWGQWAVPETEFSMLPADMSGMDAIDLGCGTGYVSAWMSRRGASVTAIDNSERQLETARRLASEHGIDIEFIHGNAETVPKPDESYDFAISEYGASIWADPSLWVPEAHRLLRPGGLLTFLGNHWLTSVCSPVDGSLPVSEHLEQPLFGMLRLDWREAVDDPGGIEFTPSTGQWVKIFAETGFEILDYTEVQAPDDAEGTPFAVTADWAKRWPSEYVWWLRKR